ncbi:hypothetical protein GOC74_02135 [Halomicrobium mukohataei]|uniref:Uncharacterized protein n=1 Tax=Halomicrobium mukohataei TaxID=57705 RepID=A0A847U8Z2_9EURY|nr:hypothetical protein [Halomicrobium mukohataei]NLV08737.1 hypothetical protein [Halomicrobium mukohataei]
MDREKPDSRAELEDPEQWPYNDVQALAAELDYGVIVGEDRQDLIEHSVEALSLDSDSTPEVTEESSEDADSVEEHADEPSPADSEPDQPIQRTDGGTQTAPETDNIAVGHEGKEKLAPEHAPDDDGTAVEPPDGVNLDGISPDDLEPTTSSTPEESVDQQENQSENAGDATEPEESESGGILDRIRGDSDRSSEEIVNDADSPEEKERRAEMRAQLADSMDGDSTDGAGDRDPSGGGTGQATQQAAGMMVDENVVGQLIAMPFNTASAATGWDGWELTQQERQANAELFIAMCDERGIDVGPTTMFALSMGGTIAGRTMQYKRQKSESSDNTGKERPSSADSSTGETDREQTGNGGGTPRIPESSGNQSESSDSDGFDFDDPSTWED